MSALLESLRDGHVLHLTLNRPAKHNALNAALCRELVEALDSADADPEVHAILLSANGKSFSAGMDLEEVVEPSACPPDLDALHQRLFTAGARLTTPIVAAVCGSALGGGTGLVANCHVVVAAPEADFGLTEINLGLWPFLVFGALATALGERRAVQLSLCGKRFKAPVAKEFGLVHEVSDDAMAWAQSAAREIANRNPVAVRQGMAFVRESRGLGAERAAELAREYRQGVFASPGFRSLVEAFVAKRGHPLPERGT
jgi:enoyl-CoA hydratase/carnithine racemase